MLYPFLLVFHFSNIIFKQHNRDEMTYLPRLALNKTPHTSHNPYLFQPEAFLNDIHLVQQILLVLIMEPEQFLKCSADKNISNSDIHMTIKHKTSPSHPSQDIFLVWTHVNIFQYEIEKVYLSKITGSSNV